MGKLLGWAGVVAGVVLVALGIASIVMAFDGRSTVKSSLKQEYISGTPDMSPSGIAGEVKEIKAAQDKIRAAANAADVPLALTQVDTPTCSVAGKPVNTGDRARCFAQYMRIHALGSTNGLVYSQLGRWIARPGTPAKFTDFNGGTSDPKYALTDPKNQRPVDNGIRNLWVTETALTTALNVSYMASQMALFSIVVGSSLLLAGIGFVVLASRNFLSRRR